MPAALTIRESVAAQINEIVRRKKENDPVEVRHVLGTTITLRVLGFTLSGSPVIHGDDSAALSAYRDGLFKCHYCQDTKRVYLHGEEREPDASRRGPGSPCKSCT